MGNQVDFNYIFFGRHEGYHRIISATILVIIVLFAAYTLVAKPQQSPEPVIITYSSVVERNPKILSYQTSSVCTQGVGVVYSPGFDNRTRMSLLTFGNEVIGVLMTWSAKYGWAPYADQPEGKPVIVRGSPFYTQTIHFTSPPTASDCSSPEDAKIAGAEVLSYENLASRNPSLSLYSKSALCREKVGVVYGPAPSPDGKPRIVIPTFKGELIGVLVAWNAKEGWTPYADQTEGKPLTVAESVIYTQTVYFKDPVTKEDCVAISA